MTFRICSCSAQNSDTIFRGMLSWALDGRIRRLLEVWASRLWRFCSVFDPKPETLDPKLDPPHPLLNPIVHHVPSLICWAPHENFQLQHQTLPCPAGRMSEHGPGKHTSRGKHVHYGGLNHRYNAWSGYLIRTI